MLARSVTVIDAMGVQLWLRWAPLVLGAALLAAAHFLPRRADTTVRSPRQRASLMASTTFNVLWLTAAAWMYRVVTTKRTEPLDRPAVAVALLFALCTDVTTLDLVLVLAMSVPPAWHGLPPLAHWAVIVPVYAYRSSHAVATAIMLPLLVVTDLTSRSNCDAMAAGAVVATLARLQ